MKQKKIELNEGDWEIFRDILKKYDAKFYAFGSRVKGTNSKFSDLDLLVEGDVIMWQLEEDFEESDLSIKIDVKKIESISKEFMQKIKEDLAKVDL